jgi:hypothetical protein
MMWVMRGRDFEGFVMFFSRPRPCIMTHHISACGDVHAAAHAGIAQTQRARAFLYEQESNESNYK